MGDPARPDLVEKATGIGGRMRARAIDNAVSEAVNGPQGAAEGGAPPEYRGHPASQHVWNKYQASAGEQRSRVYGDAPMQGPIVRK